MLAQKPDSPQMRYKVDAVLNLSNKFNNLQQTKLEYLQEVLIPPNSKPTNQRCYYQDRSTNKDNKVAPEIANHMRSRIVKEFNRMQDL